MPASWRAWAGRYLGDPNAKPTPANQEIVAAAKLRALHAGLGTWRRDGLLVADRIEPDDRLVELRHPVRLPGHGLLRVQDRRRGRRRRPARAAVSDGTPALLREEFAGSPTPGRGSRPVIRATRAARPRTRPEAGATATFTFTGKRVTWYGPVGPTRGKAKVSIDGTYVRTVDLHASGFTARKAVFTTSWSTAGAHTLTITRSSARPAIRTSRSTGSPSRPDRRGARS